MQPQQEQPKPMPCTTAGTHNEFQAIVRQYVEQETRLQEPSERAELLRALDELLKEHTDCPSKRSS